ncbi:MAG TPA: VTT domain-containing protein [Vicinamibacterales bacterium]|nr:VTT domain-containing protein [Vicinamibacterales bacterium]
MRWVVLIGSMFALIIIPFILFEKQFEALGTWLAEGHASGVLAASIIAALLALDVFLPVPSSIVSTGAGVLLGFWRGVAVIWIGMSIGCVIGYAFGAKAAGAARRLVGDEGVARAHHIMERHGNWALVVSRPIPVLAESSVVFAGIVRSPIRPFVWLTTLSNLGIALAYAAVGAFSMEMQSFLLAFAAALALPGLALLAGKIWLKSQR